MESFQVPQYIEEESRLVGSLTFVQVIILIFGGALIYLVYSLLNQWIALILITLIGAFTIILAFIQVDGTPSYKLIMPLLRHIWLPKTYIWRKPVGGSTIMKQRSEEVAPVKEVLEVKKKKMVNLDDLTKALNKGEDGKIN